MLCRDWILCLRETVNHFVPKQPAECCLNLGCDCPNPGQEPQCEDCPHLEACLSRCKTVKASSSSFKLRRDR